MARYAIISLATYQHINNCPQREKRTKKEKTYYYYLVSFTTYYDISIGVFQVVVTME